MGRCGDFDGAARDGLKRVVQQLRWQLDHFVRPGNIAEERLSNLTRDGIVCSGDTHDDYGRLIARCKSMSGVDINATLVSEGLAWAYIKYISDCGQAEAKAEETGLGIWSMRCDEPWAFREKRWEVAAQKAPNGCPIKGNISQRGRIYHTPWSKHYAATKVSLDHGERWFCNEAEAIAAGWRAPIR